MKFLIFIACLLVLFAQAGLPQKDAKFLESTDSHNRLSVKKVNRKELILAEDYNQDAQDAASKVNNYHNYIKSIVPSDMSDSEFTIWVVMICVILAGLCLACWCLKKILMFAIIIAVIVAFVLWYFYFYRNN